MPRGVGELGRDVLPTPLDTLPAEGCTVAEVDRRLRQDSERPGANQAEDARRQFGIGVSAWLWLVAFGLNLWHCVYHPAGAQEGAGRRGYE